MFYNEKIFLKNVDVSIFKNKKQLNIYLYSNNYYCLVKISENIQLKLKNQNYIQLHCNNLSLVPILQKMDSFLKQFYFCKFTKIKFTGKGYKIKKNSNKSIVLLFNRAHITTLWWKNSILKKIKKYKLYVKYTNKNKCLVDTILNVRPVNIFTKKGLRKSRQILLKKKGKK